MPPPVPVPPVVVHPLAQDRAAYAVDTVFAGLSPRSRFLRFHSPLPRLIGPMRERLIDLDGRCRAAVVAEIAGPGGAGPGVPGGAVPIGIARIAGTGTGVADIAVAVVDDWQRRGVGRRLLDALAGLAADLDYSELRGSVLPENVAMQRLARRVLPWARPWFDGDAVQFVAPIGAAAWTVTEQDVLADLVAH